MTNERRKLPRYLCSDDFSESKLRVSSQEFKMISINFNRYGIELYSHQRLPEFPSEQDCVISFEFTNKHTSMQLEKLNCKIKNRRETEVGHQYGFKINHESMADSQVLDKLITIEKTLEQANSTENRYGIFE